MIEKRLLIVTSFIKERNLYLVNPINETKLFFEEYNQYVFLKIDTECLFLRLKFNLFLEISIRKEFPKQIDFIDSSTCYDTLRRIIKRLECEGVKHRLFYSDYSDEGYNYFNYCMKLNDETCSKNDFSEAIPDLLAFKIFILLFRNYFFSNG